MIRTWLRWLTTAPTRLPGKTVRPTVEGLERRDVPTYVYPGWHGFTAVEGETVTDLNCNWHYGGQYDYRPPENYRVTVDYGDGTQEEGFVRYANGRPGSGYTMHTDGHHYTHWTDERLGFPNYPIRITLTDLNPPPGADPSVQFDAHVAVFPASTYVQTRPLAGYAVGETVSNEQVGTVRLPNADKISSPLEVAVVWNDRDVSSTANGKARVTPLGGDLFAVYVSGHTFQPLGYRVSGTTLPAGIGYGGPLPYGFTVHASTRPYAQQGGFSGHSSDAVFLNMTAEPDPLPAPAPVPPPPPPAPPGPRQRPGPKGHTKPRRKQPLRKKARVGRPRRNDHRLGRIEIPRGMNSDGTWVGQPRLNDGTLGRIEIPRGMNSDGTRR